MAKAKSVRAKTNVWKIPDLEKRVVSLIEGRALLASDGLATIVKTIMTEFGDVLAENNLRLTQFALKVHLAQLIWTRKVETDLWNAISNKMLPRFREVYAYIPELMVTKKAKTLKGLTHAKHAIAQFKAGMGVLDDDALPLDAGEFEFPRISYREPLVISTESEGQLPIINGALIGIPYTNIIDSALRRALADARKRGAVAVMLTNLFYLYNKKAAGLLAVFRAMWSGIKINPARVPAEYRQEVVDILNGTIDDKLIYQTLNEQFAELLDGLHKITHRPNNKGPEFPGPVYAVLGILEEEFIAAATYAKCRYMTIVEQNKIEAELNMASHLLASARKNEDSDGMRYWSAEVARLGRKKARTIITNIAAEHYEFYRRRIRALVVRKLEATIPNCKVISQGSTWFKVADKTVQIHIPRHDKVTDGLLASAGNNYGKAVTKDTLADLTIECHPFSLNHRMVGREDSIDGQPVTKFIRVAPSCLDAPFLRAKFADTVKAVHPAHKLINDPQLQTGVLLLKWDNGILSADRLPIEKLDRFNDTNFAYPYPKTPYINLYVDSDNHWGGVPKRFIWDRENQANLGVNEAAIEMMRRSGIITAADVPVHFTAEMDDPTDGNLWFNPSYRPDPQDMAIARIQQWLKHMTGEVRRAAERGDNTAVAEFTNEISRVVNGQLDFKGEHFPFKQMMQAFDRHLKPNIDFYSAVLGRFVKSKLTITGLSAINKSLSDTRDIGVHNFGNGNHRLHTLNGADLEGEYLARDLQGKIGMLPQWRKLLEKNPEFLAQTIRSPHFGGETFGMGLIQAPGRFKWGIRLLGAPPRLSSWSDLLKAMVHNDLARGDDTYGLLKYTTVVLMGDKHFYCEVDTETLYYFICAAGVHTDTYGSTGGFPPNNTGVMFVCLPADGPESGPIILRMLPHDFLRDWFAKPRPFDWAKFLPKPV